MFWCFCMNCDLNGNTFWNANSNYTSCIPVFASQFGTYLGRWWPSSGHLELVVFAQLQCGQVETETVKTETANAKTMRFTQWLMGGHGGAVAIFMGRICCALNQKMATIKFRFTLLAALGSCFVLFNAFRSVERSVT